MRRRKQQTTQAPPHRVEDLAVEWDVSGDAIRDALRAGRIKGFKLGRMWLIPDAEKRRIERGEPANA